MMWYQGTIHTPDDIILAIRYVRTAVLIQYLSRRFHLLRKYKSRLGLHICTGNGLYIPDTVVCHYQEGCIFSCSDWIILYFRIVFVGNRQKNPIELPGTINRFLGLLCYHLLPLMIISPFLRHFQARLVRDSVQNYFVFSCIMVLRCTSSSPSAVSGNVSTVCPLVLVRMNTQTFLSNPTLWCRTPYISDRFAIIFSERFFPAE